MGGITLSLLTTIRLAAIIVLILSVVGIIVLKLTGGKSAGQPMPGQQLFGAPPQGMPRPQGMPQPGPMPGPAPMPGPQGFQPPQPAPAPMQQPMAAPQPAPAPRPAAPAPQPAPAAAPAASNDDGATVAIIPGGAKTLVLTDVADSSKVFRADLEGGVLIGRKSSGGQKIVIDYDSSVSGKHCQVTSDGAVIMIEDLHSTNKTYLNGAEVSAKTVLRAGDHVKLGNVTFKVDIE